MLLPIDNRPPRICLITVEYPALAGGVGRSAERLVGYLLDAGAIVDIVSPLPEDSPTPPLPYSDSDRVRVHWVRIPNNPIVRLNSMQPLCATVRALDDIFHYDLFHGFFLPMAYPGLLAACRGDRPVIASLRGADGVDWLSRSVVVPFVRVVLEKATWITSVSSDLLENVSVLSGDRDLASCSSTLWNSIDPTGLPQWQPKDENRGVVGIVGRLVIKKAIPLLVEAYASLKPDLRRQLLVIGQKANSLSSDYEGDRVEKLVADLGLNEEVVLAGQIPHQQVLDMLLKMQVYVQCSHDDGLPNTLLEAAALGLPIVATNVGGMRDVLVDGENALLVPPRQPKRLAAAIERLLSDADLAARLSDGARQLVASLSPDRERQAWLELYQRFLSRN